VTPEEGEFYKLAKAANTDKVTTHNYEVLYSKYFMLGQGKPKAGGFLSWVPHSSITCLCQQELPVAYRMRLHGHIAQYVLFASCSNINIAH
jgi:hypothetical protein